MILNNGLNLRAIDSRRELIWKGGGPNMLEQDWLIYGETKYSRIFQTASISYIYYRI